MPVNIDIYTYLSQVHIFIYNGILCWESILVQLFFIFSNHDTSVIKLVLKKFTDFSQLKSIIEYNRRRGVF